MGTVDESHDHVMNARIHLNRNFREALHDLSASRGSLAVKLPVVRAADRLSKSDPAIDHDDQRALILERRGIYAHAEIVDGDPIFAVSGEVVFETDAATCAQRQGHVGV